MSNERQVDDVKEKRDEEPCNMHAQANQNKAQKTRKVPSKFPKVLN